MTTRPRTYSLRVFFTPAVSGLSGIFLNPSTMIIRQLIPDSQPRTRFGGDAICISLVNTRIPDFFTAYDDGPTHFPAQHLVNATPGGR